MAATTGLIWRDLLPTDIRLGGGLRSRQVAELVNELQLPWLDLNPSRIRRWLVDSVGGWRLALDDPYALRMKSRMRRRVANRLRLMHTLAREVGMPACILWENTKDHSALLFARRYGVPIIALPHNLESVGPPGSAAQIRYSQSGKHERFRREIELLGQADAVFAISVWDQWLLGLFDVHAEYLAYRPPRPRLEVLDRVRQRRLAATSAGEHLLVLGTAKYEPTRIGIAELVGALEALLAGSETRVVVAGAGTDGLAHLASTRVDIRGTVTTDELLDLCLRAQAAIVYQLPASGALTRIPDLLAAGVPVFANIYAARSQQDQPGLTVFQDFRDLHERLRQLRMEVAECRFRDGREIGFQRYLSNLVQRNRLADL